MNGKAQSGGVNAAILVAIIGGLIILYMIFLPTSEREKLLNDQPETPTGSADAKLLFKTNPGMLTTAQDLENEKTIPDIYLVESTSAKELDRANPFVARSGWFDKKSPTFDFEVADPENTDNVILSFSAKKKGTGVLTIKLNNEVVYENELTGGIAEPVKLPTKLLSEANTLSFEVSSVGLKFWTTNEYAFENVRIIGDITDVSRQESNNIFIIGDSEFSSMQSAILKFVPYCSGTKNIGQLDIFVNNKKVFSTVPVCDNPYRQQISKTVLNEGENVIVFKTNKGSYSVEQISLAMDFKEPSTKTYFFEINEGAYNDLRDNGRAVMLSLKFIDDTTEKRVKLDVNGRQETVETSKNLFSKDISTKLVQGNNYVRLEPFEDLEVVELKIEIA